jgi:hypothetical protein
MESIRGYLVLTAIFFLLFLTAAFLFGRYKKKKHSIARKGSATPAASRSARCRSFGGVISKAYFFCKLLKKIPWDTIIKGLAAAGFFLFSRKLIYYVYFDGVIQSKFSIWRVDGYVLISLFIIFGFILLLITLIGILKKYIQIPFKRVYVVFILLAGILLYLGFTIIIPLLEGSKALYAGGIIYREGLNLIIFTPLLLLKMFCSGKYLGLFTGIALGYFIVNRYKKLTPKINPGNAKFLIAPGAIFLVFFILCFIVFQGNWDQRLNNKLLSVSSESDMVDLLDAVHSIYREEARYQSLEPIAAFIEKEKEFRWKKEIYQRIIDEVKTLIYDYSSRLLEKIVLWIAKTGDIPWAIEVAMSIPDKNIRTNVLKVLREKLEVK